MKTIDAHETEAVVDATGSVRIGELPFATGDRVRVLVLRPPQDLSPHPRHTIEDISRSKLIRHGLKGTILSYERPNDPVGVEDWDMLRDDEAAK